MTNNIGKRLALIGLACSAFASLASAVIWATLNPEKGAPVQIFSNALSVASLVECAALICVALGHFVMFARKRAFVDLICCGSVGLYVVMSVLWQLVFVRISSHGSMTAVNIALGILFAMYPLSLFFRQRLKNGILAILLLGVCAYRIILGSLLSLVLYKFAVDPYLTNAVSIAVGAACTGVCFLAVLSISND